MARCRLKIYNGPEAAPVNSAEFAQDEQRVTVSLGQIFPLLADAVQSERTWLDDFEDDPITISSDLYDVILAYQHFRPSA